MSVDPPTNIFNIFQMLAGKFELKMRGKRRRLERLFLQHDYIEALIEENNPIETLKKFEVDDEAIEQFTRDFIDSVRKASDGAG